MKSFRESPSFQGVNPLTSEHLAEGIKPIYVCIDYRARDVIKMFDEDENAIDVDHYAACLGISTLEVSSNETCKVGVMSSLDETNKFSSEFRNCIGFIAVGRKESDMCQSILLHVDPIYFKGDYSGLQELLTAKLELLKAESVTDTIDTVIFGGRIPDTNQNSDFDYELEHYQTAVTILGKMVKEVLGFNSVVIPPKPDTHQTATSAFFDTNNRRLYIAQSPLKNSSLQNPFLSSDVNLVTPKYISPLSIADDMKGGWED